MFRRGRKWRFAGLAAVAAIAMVAAGCGGSSSPSSSSSSSGTPVNGGTATVALPAGITYDWIFPFYAITNSSVYNAQQFQYLMFRPLYMFGNNTNTSVSVNYPLSPASAPVYSNGGKTVVVTMKGWKWSNGETVNAKDLVFYLNMTEAEKANWYAYSKGLLPDNIVSYKATGANQVTFQLNKPYSSLWYTYNQLAELTPMPMAWDVTSLTGKPGSGGCTTDSAADNWAKCQAVYLPHRPVEAVRDLCDQPALVGGGRAVEAVPLQHDGQRDHGGQQGVLRQPQAEAGGDQVRAVHR
jgi:peptide/nickel transport system substrate-binding protein